MSNYVVHFTRGGEGHDDYRTMLGILGSGILKPKQRFGIGKDRAPAEIEQRAVCFSEIPAGQWSRLERRRETKYGVAFTKEFILSQGGGPIWYAWKDTPHWLALQRLMASSVDDADAHIWKISPMIDAPGRYGHSDYLFDWEREWRCVGPMNFRPDDVAFLLIPEQLHGAAHGFFENALTENTGPAYFCPYVDPAWDKETVLDALRR